MEQTLTSGAKQRLATLQRWLHSLPQNLGLVPDSLRPASSDASFRRYYRIESARGSVIIMDAPPPHEDCRPFIEVGRRLNKAGLYVPDVLAENLADGFLLLSDLGNCTFYQIIQQGLPDARLQSMYRGALDTLVQLQHADASGLALYDAARLQQELTVFPEWYAQKHCQAPLTDAEQAALASVVETLAYDNARQPSVLVHRDFHSPNLMVGSDDARPGIIDHQDALLGPITYDIASLVMDARTTWEEPQQLDWAIRYWQAARASGLPVGDDFAVFHRAYEWMGLQRNLRILGVFARLSHRDGKHHYLDHIPRVSAYARQVASRYGEFRPLLRILDRIENHQAAVGFTF